MSVLIGLGGLEGAVMPGGCAGKWLYPGQTRQSGRVSSLVGDASKRQPRQGRIREAWQAWQGRASSRAPSYQVRQPTLVRQCVGEYVSREMSGKVRGEGVGEGVRASGNLRRARERERANLG